jgi:hypothetical protein
MYGRAIIEDDKQAFNMGRTIKDDKQPSRMINIHHTRHGAWPWIGNMWYGGWYDDENFARVLFQGEITRHGAQKLDRMKDLRKNITALFLSLSLSLCRKETFVMVLY